MKHSGVVGYGLAELYCYVTGETQLEGAHDSLFDAMAQYKVCKHGSFNTSTVLDRSESFMLLEDVWKANRARFEARSQEIERSVPTGWTEEFPADAKCLDPETMYKSSSGGPTYGPTARAFQMCRGKTLSVVFLLLCPETMWDTIARETNRYGAEDWVRSPASSEGAEDDESIGPQQSSSDDDDDEAVEDRTFAIPGRARGQKRIGWAPCRRQ